jgi:hypothetical protein
MLRFVLIAVGVVVAVGVVWFIAHAASHPSSRADATTAGNAASTTPSDAVNGGGVAGTGGSPPQFSASAAGS